MKSTFAILTLFVAAITVTPRQSFGQYTWVPVYTDETAAGAVDATYEQTGYATLVSEDLEDFDNTSRDCDSGGKGSGKGGGKGCGDCPQCRIGDWANRSFVGIEFLHWYNKGRTLPPLVTGGDAATTAFTAAGVIGQPNTTLLFGGGDVGMDLQAGLRLTGGLWLDDCETSAVVVRAYGAEGDQSQFTAASTGAEILAVPFVGRAAGATFGLNNALVLAYAGGLTPGVTVTGSVDAQASNDVFGGDVYGRTLLDRGCDYRIDLLGGYQMARIDDDLELSTVLNQFPGPNTFTTQDLFDVENEYHAGTLGVMGEIYNGPLTIQMMGKIGIGNMNQRVAISGSNTINAGAATAGGIFAQPPNNGAPFNIGTYERNLLVWSPEASIKATYCVSDRLSVTVGYTLLYWTRVALAGDQVDTDVNQSVLYGGPFLAGSANPTFTFRDTDFWVQTIDLGLTFEY